MNLDIMSLIGEATTYDKKEMLEVRHPKAGLRVYQPLLMAKVVL